ncbi:RHS repeat-associated core domain-containing protein [Amycolatopsis rhizosphaerae]|uniref:RHS repeat-associated core domain-containing protein n=1 Tax=Amycolatopsis rhizosphaerae TaxID=2053003 RepID=UPI001643A9D5|nr:RHS repeat-associated core domain-containing protein [Amycolatopsis rhizosphaerae]
MAQKQDSTTAISGIAVLEDAQGLKESIESGDWASAVMGAAGTAMDALAFVTDPFGSILANGVGWLMEHVGPLKEALDKLAGDPDQITAHAETWKNIASELGQVATDLGTQVSADVQSWTGPGADAYRRQAEEVAKVLEGAGQACEGASSGVKTAGEVVAAVRQLVRDTIAQVVGHMVSWALQVLFTLGIGLTWVVPQVVNLVAKTAKNIAQLMKNLLKALGDLGKLFGKAGDLFKKASNSLKGLKSGEKATHAKLDNLPTGAKNVDPVAGRPTTPEGATHASSATNGSHSPRGTGDTRSGTSTDTGGGATPPPSPSVSTRGFDNGSTGPSSTRPSSAPKNPRDSAVEPGNRVCESDPVDVATGEVVLEQRDLDLGALVLDRTHVSSYRAGHWFGTSWASTLDQRLELDDEHIRYFSPTGTILVYPRGDGEQWPLEGSRWPLTRTADGYTLQAGERVLEFSGSGTVLPLRAFEAGQRVEVFYDDHGAPAQLRREDGVRVGVRAERGRVVELAVLGDGTLADVPVAKFGYDDRRRLTQIVNSSGLPLRFDYDDAGRITGWQDRNGVWYRYVYDNRGRCVRTVGDGGFLDGAFEYGDHVTRHTDSLGNVTEFHLNDAHQVVREVDPLGGVTVSEWDRYDRLLARTDPLGRTTRYGYDDAGTVSEVHRPDGSTVLLEHDDSGEIAAITVQSGEVSWHRRYDGGAPDPLTEPIGVATSLSLATGEPPAPTGVEPDQFGRPRWLAETGGERVRLGWTVEGRPASRVGPRQERAVWRYDGEGNETEHVDELGRVTRREYGPFDRLTALTDPSGARTTYTYDTELRLTSVTDPRGRVWRYRYDALGRLVEQTDFGGRTHGYTYDPAGQLVRSTDPDGLVTEYRYDPVGNLVEVRAPGRITAYRYDPAGQLVHAANGESTVEFERDEYGRVVRETVDGRSVTFEYGIGFIHRRTPGGVESTWTFDDLDRPVGLTGGRHAVRYRYDLDGRVTSRTDDATVLGHTYGPGGALVAQTVTTTGNVPVQRRVFSHHADGSLATLHDEVTGLTTLTRDAAGRITAATTPQGREEYHYDVSGALIAPAGVTVTEDGHGRRASRRQAAGAHAYSWSGDRLAAVTTGDGAVWQYHYDPLGRRVGKTLRAPDGTTRTTLYTWDGTRLIEEAGPGHLVTWDHVPGTVVPVAQRERDARGERFRTFVTDAIGTPTDLLDERGALVWTSRRTAHGRELTAAPTPLRFPGQYADAETGLHYNVFRYYDPVTARYLSQDPLGLEPGPDPYAYVTDPYARYDAIGLMDCTKTSGADNPVPPTPKAGHGPGNTGGSAGKPTPPPVPPKLSAKKPGPKKTPPPRPTGPKPDLNRPKPTASQTQPAGAKPPPPPVPPKPDLNRPKPEPSHTQPEPSHTQPGSPPPKPQPSSALGTEGNPASKPPASKDDFHPVESDDKPSRGGKQPLGTYTFKPEPQRVGGTGYNGVTPMQEHVFQGLIDDKIKDWRAEGVMDQPVKVPVYYPPNAPNVLKIDGDGHHRFAAAMESGRPIELVLRKQPAGMGLPNTMVDWTGTTIVEGWPKPGQWIK